MKDHLRRVVESVISADSVWRITQPLIRVANGLARARRRTEELRILGKLSPNKTVLSGPFKGMQYPKSSKSVGSALLPKLVGSYECELHSLLESTIIPSDYDIIIDVGCAEGYYAIGLARACPAARIYAFDTAPQARLLCNEMAELNGVSDRITIRSHFGPEDVPALREGKRVLMIADCEGYEESLLCSSYASTWSGIDILVEAHDFISSGIADRIENTLTHSHACERYKSINAHEKVTTYSNTQLESLCDQDKLHAVDENRPGVMEWLFLTANSEVAALFHQPQSCVADDDQ